MLWKGEERRLVFLLISFCFDFILFYFILFYFILFDSDFLFSIIDMF